MSDMTQDENMENVPNTFSQPDTVAEPDNAATPTESEKNYLEQSEETRKRCKYFYVKQKQARPLREKMKAGTITPEERQKLEEIESLLWRTMDRYARSLIPDDNSAPEGDYKQAMAVAFFEHLYDYNPRVAAPTTFFLRYFLQAINETRIETSGRTKAYDTNNIKVVKAAINEFVSMGVDPNFITPQMIATKTGKSEKVVTKTMAIMHQTNFVAIDGDESVMLKSNIPTPEEAFEENELRGMLSKVIDENLNDVERRVFMLHVFGGGTKTLSFKNVGEKIGLSESDVRKIFSNAHRKLVFALDNTSYSRDYHRFAKQCLQSSIEFTDDTADLMAEQLMDHFDLTNSCLSVQKKMDKLNSTTNK